MINSQVFKKPPKDSYTGNPDEWEMTENSSGNMVADLYADKDIKVGNLYISKVSENEENYLVTYEIIAEDWFLTEIQFEGIVEGELDYLRSNGGLIPGKFTVKENVDIVEGLKEFSFYYNAGDEIKSFAAHAVVSKEAEVEMDGDAIVLQGDEIITEIVNESVWAYAGEFDRIFKNWSQYFSNEVEYTEVIDIVLITDESGLESENNTFNVLAKEGLDKAVNDFEITTWVIESSSSDDYLDNISAAVLMSPDLIITVGFTMVDATSEAAVLYPGQAFAIIDGTIDKPNVTSISFKEHEGSFLVGVIAGMISETTTVGFIGGMEFPLIQKFQFGYMAGVTAAMTSSAAILVDYVGSFSDFDLGKTYAVSQQAIGADVIFQAAGYSGFGVIESTGETGIWAIGVDMDQSYLSPESVLCSMIKKIDKAVYILAESLDSGNFVADYRGKSIERGLKEEGVGYSDLGGKLTNEAIAAAELYRNEIIDANITVPYDEATYNAFLLTLP